MASCCASWMTELEWSGVKVRCVGSWGSPGCRCCLCLPYLVGFRNPYTARPESAVVFSAVASACYRLIKSRHDRTVDFDGSYALPRGVLQSATTALQVVLRAHCEGHPGKQPLRYPHFCKPRDAVVLAHGPACDLTLPTDVPTDQQYSTHQHAWWEQASAVMACVSRIQKLIHAGCRYPRSIPLPSRIRCPGHLLRECCAVRMSDCSAVNPVTTS